MALSLDTNNPSTISTPSHPPYLLLGPTSTRVASLTIASLAAGRGYALPLLVAPFLEYRGVRMIRPLTSTGKKEMVWYARMRGLEVVDWDWESGARSVETGKPTSIEALTQGT
jgi:tRNA(Ile)-lysidine synthase TilS/MesJ